MSTRMHGAHIKPGQLRGGFTDQRSDGKRKKEHPYNRWSIQGIRDAANQALMKRGIHNQPTAWSGVSVR